MKLSRRRRTFSTNGRLGARPTLACRYQVTYHFIHVYLGPRDESFPLGKELLGVFREQEELLLEAQLVKAGNAA